MYDISCYHYLTLTCNGSAYLKAYWSISLILTSIVEFDFMMLTFKLPSAVTGTLT
ncbi:MAG: hypothetical protein JWR38_3564 [Mucilaginibacter sp.]|nr:hypothetical protein [Mucilaginibacter sp.]